jgi:quinol monooxygenase YgiN
MNRQQGQDPEEIMILATIRMTIPPQKRGRVSKTLKSMARETRIQPGCISSRIYRDESEEAVFMFEEVWRNQDDLDRYLRSEDYRRMLLVMEMASEPPEVKFQTISSQAGLEVVEKARGCKRDE